MAAAVLQKFVEQILRGLGAEVHEEGETLSVTTPRGRFLIAFLGEGGLDEFLEASREVEGRRIVVPAVPLGAEEGKTLALVDVVEWRREEVEDEVLAVMLGRKPAAESRFGRL